jgi:predicted DNA binding CopG/RHH family protein
MQQSVESSPALSPSSFASLLAALTAPPKKADSAWNEDGLEDDVATLSYERALRTHARYRAESPSDQSLTQPSNARSIDSYEVDASPAASSIARSESWSATNPDAAYDRNLKSASITIRMSTSECDQLRKRAAEAGLTVSAYLRSCTFEAESLRALVKDTLAQLQPEAQKRKQAAVARPRRSWLRHSCLAWLPRLLPHWPANQRVAQA